MKTKNKFKLVVILILIGLASIIFGFVTGFWTGSVLGFAAAVYFLQSDDNDNEGGTLRPLYNRVRNN
ncbi:MAG: hypothetical protein V7767_01125 [Leeuwenhoekiella sp.]